MQLASLQKATRLQKAALSTGVLTLLLVGVGAAKRVMGISGGPLEDVNRVLGALVGAAALGTLVFAVRHARRSAALVGAAFLALCGVGAAGFLGVKGGATFDARTLAMLQVAATLVVCLALVTAAVLARAPEAKARRGLAAGSAGALVFVLVQMALGVNARASVDALTRATPPIPREERFENLGVLELAHVQAGPLVMLVVLALWLASRARHKDAGLPAHAITLALAASVAQVLLGLVLVWLALPPAAQVLHLGGALITATALAAAVVSAARGA